MTREAASEAGMTSAEVTSAAAGDWLAINTIRTLTIDAVQAAQSGHPGAAMALAPVGYTLWNDVLRYDVHDPGWPNRDRFVLSAGHASMLLYSLLHLAQVRRSPLIPRWPCRCRTSGASGSWAACAPGIRSAG